MNRMESAYFSNFRHMQFPNKTYRSQYALLIAASNAGLRDENLIVGRATAVPCTLLCVTLADVASHLRNSCYGTGKNLEESRGKI